MDFININLPINKSAAIREIAAKYITAKSIDINTTLLPDDVLIMQKAVTAKNEFNFGDAGTPLRLMIGIWIAMGKQIKIDCSEGLKLRPIKDLLLSLEACGAVLEYENIPHSIPFTIVKGIDLDTNELTINNTLSSQFLSSCLFIAAYTKKIKFIYYKSKNSWAYVNQSLNTLKNYGLGYSLDTNKIMLNYSNFEPTPLILENDWSSFFYFANAVIANEKLKVCVSGLSMESDQADRVTLKVYAQLGLKYESKNNQLFIWYEKTSNLPEIIDIEQIIDSGPALISLIAFMQWNIKITGYDNLQYKESNRVQSLQKNLALFDISLIENKETFNYLSLSYPNDNYKFNKNIIASENDHRIVMAMSLFSLQHSLRYDNKNCVTKSFPDYWNQWNKIISTTQ